jgi:hypothetical protein
MALKKYLNIFIVSIALMLSASQAAAFDDGFGSAKKIEGKYIVAYYPSDTDPAELVQALNMRASDKIMAGESSQSKKSYEEELAQALDTLYIQVSNILEMHLYSLKTIIKICKDEAQLTDIYTKMFNADLGGRRSFYVYSFGTIYISKDSFTREILGHEMSHVIISNYFVIPTPVKIQEVLSMYVEYNLRSNRAD